MARPGSLVGLTSLIWLLGCASAIEAASPKATAPAADISGIWLANPPLDWVDPATDEIPLTAAYSRELKRWRDAADSGHPVADSVARCEAFGMPRFMSFGAIEILQTSKQITMIAEILHEVRRVYLDGRRMPDDFDASYGGYSTGRWVNGVLTVNTTGLQAGTLDQYGIPHSDQLQITESLRLVSRDVLEDRVTLNDRLAYTKPWIVVRTYKRAPADFELQEYICNTNNAAMKQE